MRLVIIDHDRPQRNSFSFGLDAPSETRYKHPRVPYWKMNEMRRVTLKDVKLLPK